MKSAGVRFAVLTLLVGLLASSGAHARDLVQKGQGMDARVFRPAVDTKGHFSVDSTPVLPHLSISAGLFLDFAVNHLVAPEAMGRADDSSTPYGATMMDSYINGVLTFNIGLFDMFAAGLQLPIGFTSGTAYNPQDPDNDDWGSSGGVGDLSIHIKARWLRADLRKFGLGTVLRYQIPTGKERLLMGEPGAGTIFIRMIGDMEVSETFRSSLNLGARLPLGAESDNNLFDEFNAGSGSLLFHYGPMLTFGVGNSWSFWPEVMDLIFEFYGHHLFTEMANVGYLSMEANVGLKIHVQKSSYLLAGYAHGIPVGGNGPEYGFQAAEHRGFVGFAFEPSVGDMDYDGIKDDLDACPNSPEDLDDYSDADGCPEFDNDRDGISDIADKCPNAPEDFDGEADEDGCPDAGVEDRDGDGFIDTLDKCPDDPEDLDEFEDEDGCPDKDNDADGILDAVDQCPNDAEDKDGFEDEDGCADLDNDQDNIPDADDKCPNEREVLNGLDDEDGCPDENVIEFTGNVIEIKQEILFEYDSSKIKPVSYPIIDAVADFMLKNPFLELVEVEGNADERGDDAYNLELTGERAEAVMNYLINRKGIKRQRLRSIGYGEYCPKNPGHDEAAWAENRRVNFRVLVKDGELTGAQQGCDLANEKGVKSRKIRIRLP